MKKIILASILFIVQFAAQAQGETVDMADTMRANGKIYVVVGVILIIFAGIILYLVRLDQKITRLEKQK